MGEQVKKGQIIIVAKNIKGNAKGKILEESKKTKNIVEGKFYQNGKKGGVNNDKKKDRKPPLELRVLRVEGPFDEKDKKVDAIEKDKWYTYKVTQFNREPKKGELQNLRWGVKYEDGTLKDLNDVSCKGLKEIDHKVYGSNNSSKLRIYAFFKAPNDNASVEIEIETICDAVMVVGSELHEPTYGNKMRFFAQAVRTLILNKGKWKKVSLIYFNYKNKYNSAEINEVKKSLSSYFVKDIEFVSIKTVSEMINKINSYKKIKMLHFYSHGMPSKITFGLGHIAENIDGAQTFTFSDISKLKKSVFDKNAQIHSYACRTGNAQKDPMQDDFTSYYTIHYFAGKADFTEKHLTKESAQKRYNELKRGFSNVYLYEPSTSPSEIHSEQSLAQKLANYTGISVFAFKTRSDYQPTWHGNFKKIEIPDESVEKGWFGTKFWQDGDHALWNSTGALNGVKGGSTPKGLDNKLTEFKP
ncbi:hypothetical protein [Chryseobacterium sp. CCH4-E10]|uniref:hypothetical protein n=1 Tax=Chryseobacterium sp. CCH4-E10 TaxID=1768758 RepID=UPI00083554C8|nr:hypothetical protein [Chryseobacterium sp. CCH4-E10]